MAPLKVLEKSVPPLTVDLKRRLWSTNGVLISGSAKWAFFAILIVLIIVVILGTLRVNKRRSKFGAQPLYGTRWMTPPLYRQSQTQYNQPNRRDPELPSAYVPTYTATANETDMGYYDAHGEFHPNPNAKSATVIPPPEAHHRQNSTTSNGVPINNNFTGGTVTDEVGHDRHDDDGFDDMFRPPTTAPPTTTTPTYNFMLRPQGEATENVSQEEYDRPDGPPPAREGSSSQSESLPSFTEGKSPPKVSEKSQLN
ncbi:uncharacterized protein CANTADRAFT_25396 [Suhomyces tanzawaensis NRRL Y-17324]|uniref:Uncharacterized protein n=1 Tax=Suhomyces tanzawaensis NRRL Y-17324 TaxID=984487 RepID=A0A1E4SNS0_9ASCO|nr:uncharacterized protein CANTADRAFT_25396 [Suhomyces tanzawaensis NRRL Y-17324]ODV81171.1 hypothetical protein CANTADRAFT_25396 [Suhomyces tanzawaensis NRRL Y-17324]